MVEATIGAVADRASDADEVDVVNRSARRGSVIAGLALLAMTPLAAFANFAVLDALVTPGDAARTASAVLNADGTFRFAVASLFVVAALDLVAAWALYAVFKPVSDGTALLMAWFRVVFAGVFVVAISRLVGALSILEAAGSPSAFSAEQHYAQALLGIDAFYDIWDAALILVGLHLVTLGYLVYRSGAVPSYPSGYVPTALGVLLAIAGVGYVVDSFGRVLVAGYSLEVAAFTFVGEVLLILWLLIQGRRIGLGEAAASTTE